MARGKTVAIVGATGAQGGGLARAVFADRDREFSVRALTRKPDSDKAKALATSGAEVVRADLNDVESLRNAFRGADAAFCVTNYWELLSPEKEREQATNLAEAAAREGVPHVIWSTLEDTRKWIPLSDDRMPTLMGRYKVPHFDAKGEADAEFARRNLPTTFFLASFYWENLIYFGSGPKRGPDGTLLLTLPMGAVPLAGIAVEDIGKCALGILKVGAEYIGRSVGVAGEHLTGDEMASALTKALGEEVRYNDVPPDVFRSFDFPGADDVGNMFQFYRDFPEVVLGARDIGETRALNPEVMTFDSWLSENARRIPLD